MINKKLLVAASLAAIVSASSAFARTEGNYVGAYIMNSDVDHDLSSGASFGETQIGFGIDYKHAFPIAERFFIAPGVFTERNGLRSSSGTTTVENDFRYGAKLNLGIDVVDNFNIYFTNGISANHYKFTTPGTSRSGTEMGYFYGLGAEYALNSEFSINAEMNMQDVDFDTTSTTTNLDSQLTVFKIGASYHF